LVCNALLKELLKKQNGVELTAEQLTQLKEHIQVLKNAAALCEEAQKLRSTLVCIKGW